MFGERAPGDFGTPPDDGASGTYDGAVRFEVLGSLRIVAPVDAGASVPAPVERSLGGPKQRLVLALLLAEPNLTVSVDRLIDGVWGEDPPDSARHTLQAYVAELRKVVGDVIERDGIGYVLRATRSDLDALDLEARVSGALALVERDPVTAARDLEDALALWRGRAYEEYPDQPLLQAEASRLEELRLAGIEGLCRARMALGEPAKVLRDLGRLTREHPYREELRALQMLALYRSGRQADALRVFQTTRAQLAEDLGIDPSPRLRRLEEQILLQDPDLDPTDRSAAEASTGARVENPYMGLRSFRESDASRFYGQDRLVASLIERVLGPSTFTALVGPSGSGKSSAVQAGLLPRIRSEAPLLGVALMQPGSQPFAELEASLAAWSSGLVPPIAELRRTDAGLIDAVGRLAEDAGGLLLVVDQFEEVFTLADPEEASAFVAALVRAAADPEGRVHVLATMRADFYDRPLADPRLGPVFASNVVNVIPLAPDELEAAATMPARQMDVAVDGRLVGRLIADVAGQPNALPLFQYTLTELFDERSSSRLDLATYERIGGVRKAVARRAEWIYTRLGREEQAAARQLFLRIATVWSDTVSRRRVPASELASLTVDIVALQGAIDAFARYRLLALDRDPTTGGPTVEVAHEALLVEWHRLRDWIEECREDLATHARFVVALNEWEAAGRDLGYLLSGSRLDDYQGWASGMQLTDDEMTFVEQSSEVAEATGVRGREAEARAKRLQRRTRWQLVALFAAVALLAGIVGYPLLTADEPPHRVAIALEFRRGESGFDELLGRGMDRAGQQLGVDAVVLQPPYSDLGATVADLASDSDLVFGSAAMWDVIALAASGDTDTTFVLMDSYGAPELPNAVAVTFALEQGSYLVGAAAALESETGKIGYIGANGNPITEEFRSGFEQGARAARPDIEIISSLIDPVDLGGGYANVERAAEIAEWMYREQGVDVIYTAAGRSGFGTIDVATWLSADVGRHLWAIGVDTDFVFDLPSEQRDHVLTSMVKRLDHGVETIVAAYEEGRLRVPSTVDLGLADGAVGYTTSGDHLQSSTLEALEDLEEQIIRGEIDVDDVPTGAVMATPSGSPG